ncbi:MAG: TQO small subunit DoxD [Promethearchaeota archaeon]
MNTKQWTFLLLAIIVDVILGAIVLLTLGPDWLIPDTALLVPNLNLIVAPLLGISILLVPTLFFFRLGWAEKITNTMLALPLRLGLAYEFLHGGLGKLLDPTYLASPGILYAGGGAQSPWVREFLSLLVANYAFWLSLIAIGELLVGLSLLLGGFTRIGAFGGILLQWTFLFLLGWLSVSTFGINFLGSLAFFIVGALQAGRFLGIDQFLGPKLEESQNQIIKGIACLT